MGWTAVLMLAWCGSGIAYMLTLAVRFVSLLSAGEPAPVRVLIALITLLGAVPFFIMGALFGPLLLIPALWERTPLARRRYARWRDEHAAADNELFQATYGAAGYPKR